MKIAFTSCCDTDNDNQQVAWDQMSAQAPDVIVLLGDSIYMDYKWPGDKKWGNGEPRDKPLDQFSQRMHAYYARQWSVASFARAIARPEVFAIWDDHDFGFNNGRGGGHAPSDPLWMSPEMRRLSRLLFEQFRQALKDKPAIYPPNPCPSGIVAEPDDLGGIQTTVDLSSGLRLHLLDGRSFRGPASQQSSMLGMDQRHALEKNWLARPGINLLASGTTLEDWGRYSDRDWLFEQAAQVHVLVLSGDIHRKRFLSEAPVFEATASAMAQPPKATYVFGKRTEVFGTLEVGASTIDVSLFQGEKRPERHRIDLQHWSDALAP